MTRLRLRSEHLGPLSTDDLRRVAGAHADIAGTISGGSCWASGEAWGPLHLGGNLCDPSGGSCACGC